MDLKDEREENLFKFFDDSAQMFVSEAESIVECMEDNHSSVL